MILITGGGGFIGTNCALHFVESGQDVLLVDREVTGRTLGRDLVPGVTFEPINLLEFSAFNSVVQRYDVTGIIHLAAPIDLEVSAGNYMLAAATMTRNVLEAALAAGVKRVTMASSIAVYFGVEEAPYREHYRLPVASPTPISAIKKADELIAGFVSRSTSLEIISLRLANVYGPRYRSMFNTPSRLCHSALGRSLPPPPKHGAPDIIALAQDYCYIGDCVRAIEMIQTASKLNHSIYNIGSGAGSTEDDIAAAVRLALDGGVSVGPPPNAANRYLDLSLIKADVGFEPRYDLCKGIAAYVEWLREHEY